MMSMIVSVNTMGIMIDTVIPVCVDLYLLIDILHAHRPDGSLVSLEHMLHFPRLHVLDPCVPVSRCCHNFATVWTETYLRHYITHTQIKLLDFAACHHVLQEHLLVP